MDFVCKLYGNTYAVHITVALVGVATLNLALPAPPPDRRVPKNVPSLKQECGGLNTVGGADQIIWQGR